MISAEKRQKIPIWTRRITHFYIWIHFPQWQKILSETKETAFSFSSTIELIFCICYGDFLLSVLGHISMNHQLSNLLIGLARFCSGLVKTWSNTSEIILFLKFNSLRICPFCNQIIRNLEVLYHWYARKKTPQTLWVIILIEELWTYLCIGQVFWVEIRFCGS